MHPKRVRFVPGMAAVDAGMVKFTTLALFAMDLVLFSWRKSPRNVLFAPGWAAVVAVTASIMIFVRFAKAPAGLMYICRMIMRKKNQNREQIDN